MPKLDLSNAKRIKIAPGEVVGLRGAGWQWARDPLVSLYGTGVGQIPMDIRPEDAVFDGSGNVVSVPNRGGAGAMFNATASATGIKVENGRFSIATTGPWLNLANIADMVGVRLFMQGYFPTPVPTTSTNYAGRSAAATIDDGRNNIRWNWTASRMDIQRYSYDSGTGTSQTLSAALLGPAIAADTAVLIELEMVGGTARMFMNGVEVASQPYSFPTFSVNRIFAGQNTPFFQGQAGPIVSLIVDGVSDLSAQIATIRALYQ